MEVCQFAENCHNFLSLAPFGLQNIDPGSPKLLTLKFTGVPFHLPSLVTLIEAVLIEDVLIEAEIAGRGRICPPPFPGRVILRPFPVRMLSSSSMRVTCEFKISGPHRLTCTPVRIFLQAFTRRHMPCAMCHQSTHDRHHRRSGVLARRMVPRRSRSDQPFGRYFRKCLDTHMLTDWLTDKHGPANYFSPTHQRKSSFIERSMLKHLNVHSLRFWIMLVSACMAWIRRRLSVRETARGPKQQVWAQLSQYLIFAI